MKTLLSIILVCGLIPSISNADGRDGDRGGDRGGFDRGDDHRDDGRDHRIDPIPPVVYVPQPEPVLYDCTIFVADGTSFAGQDYNSSANALTEAQGQCISYGESADSCYAATYSCN